MVTPFYRSHGKIATVTGMSSASQVGELQIGGSFVEHLREKTSSSDHFVSRGFYVFNHSFFTRLTDDETSDLEGGST